MTVKGATSNSTVLFCAWTKRSSLKIAFREVQSRICPNVDNSHQLIARQRIDLPSRFLDSPPTVSRFRVFLDEAVHSGFACPVGGEYIYYPEIK